MFCPSEVYEHLVYDGREALFSAVLPELRDRSIVVGSFGKTFHVTGWKTGYCIASPELMKLFRQDLPVCQFLVHTDPNGLGHFMQQHPEHIEGLADFYQEKA